MKSIPEHVFVILSQRKACGGRFREETAGKRTGPITKWSPRRLLFTRLEIVFVTISLFTKRTKLFPKCFLWYMYACSSLFYITGESKLLLVTKVVTLRDFEQNDPLPHPEKWVKCFRVADCLQELSTYVMQEWEFPYTDHVLLHIDVPNQQLYHLPLLVTPVHCVYLVMFDL